MDGLLAGGLAGIGTEVQLLRDHISKMASYIAHNLFRVVKPESIRTTTEDSSPRDDYLGNYR